MPTLTMSIFVQKLILRILSSKWVLVYAFELYKTKKSYGCKIYVAQNCLNVSNKQCLVAIRKVVAIFANNKNIQRIF